MISLVKEWRNQMTELNKKHQEDMSALLSKEQKAQIEKKTGAKKNGRDRCKCKNGKNETRLDLNDDQMER